MILLESSLQTMLEEHEELASFSVLEGEEHVAEMIGNEAVFQGVFCQWIWISVFGFLCLDFCFWISVFGFLS